jgi:hypothetical protein
MQSGTVDRFVVRLITNLSTVPIVPWTIIHLFLLSKEEHVMLFQVLIGQKPSHLYLTYCYNNLHF